MVEDLVINVPVTKATASSPNPTIGITDYPFEILLDISPTEEILELIYSEELEFLELGTTETTIFAKLLLWTSKPYLARTGLKLRTTGVDGKKLENYKIRYFLNHLARLD